LYIKKEEIFIYLRIIIMTSQLIGYNNICSSHTSYLKNSNNNSHSSIKNINNNNKTHHTILNYPNSSINNQ